MRDRRLRFRPLWVACAATLSLAGACDEREGSPERTINRFLKAAALGDAKEVYLLLAPADQQALRQRAQLATAQAGGRQRIEPHDLLATTLTSPELEVGRVEMIKASRDHARVKLFAPKGGRAETWELRRVDGKWRVKLPQATFERLAR